MLNHIIARSCTVHHAHADTDSYPSRKAVSYQEQTKLKFSRSNAPRKAAWLVAKPRAVKPRSSSWTLNKKCARAWRGC